VVATLGLRLRGHGLNTFEDMCVFLILARRGLYGEMRMRMSFAGRVEWKRQNRVEIYIHILIIKKI
jgi:hypothetical protein